MLAQISLGGLDYAAISAYCVLVLLIAVWFSRQQRSSGDYLLAGRSMGWIVVGISQLASLLSAISYLGNPGEAYAYDLRFLVYSVCGLLAVLWLRGRNFHSGYGHATSDVVESVQRRTDRLRPGTVVEILRLPGGRPVALPGRRTRLPFCRNGPTGFEILVPHD